MKTFDDVAREAFKLPEGAISDTLSSKDIPEWDSMNYLLFISALEKEFGLSFSMDEVMGAQTIGDLRRIVEARRTKS
jgi:acyl carrier protein